MSWIRRTIIVSVLGAWGCTPAPQVPTTVQWNDTAAQEVRAQVEGTMNAFASKDLERFKAGLAPDVVAFEMDLESKPVRIGSRDDAVRYAEEMFAQVKKTFKSLTLDFHSTDCRATSTLAYCTVEFDFQATMLDGSTVLQPSRNTVVLRKGDDGWKWTHWHSSLAVPPAPSPAQK
ncbi:MAG: nuclear transport factor 2 family protein [Deltaproteobacteria bacterium]|nr:nuclear transport factor 2 family protein [Deltaproteobacteria bacterium]